MMAHQSTNLGLADALKRARAAEDRSGKPFEVFLATGFEPLHLATFLKAHLGERLTDRPISLETGEFGDLIGNIARGSASHGTLAVVIEWSDLDPRLGHRALASWRPDDLSDIASEAAATAVRLKKQLLEASQSARLAVALPSLPIAPIFPQRPGALSRDTATLNRILWDCAEELAAVPRISLVDTERLASTPDDANHDAVHDVKSELATGFPFSLPYASLLGARLAETIVPPPRMKGLITDLDNTLWRGIVGEDGPENIAFSLEGNAQMHGLYQLLLTSLTETGVLLAIASKNSAEIVDEAFARPDMLFQRDVAYPLEINWEAKSQSVSRILEAWNIAPDSVVFVDDSELELAEVKAALPEITCLHFPTDNDPACLALLHDLRALFGTAEISEEDRLRASSVRAAEAFNASAQNETSDQQTGDFLARIGQQLRLRAAADADDIRAYELVNKTNQFNLNGRRYQNDEWQEFFQNDGAVMLTAHYEDKFGPLGKIAAVGGEQDTDTLHVRFWVMSCRAFGRNIEYACMQALFESCDVKRITFDYTPTDRNQPLLRFLEFMIQPHDAEDWSIDREAFASLCPPLHHTIEMATHG